MHSEQFQLHAEIEERHWWFVARRRILREIVRTICPPAPGKNSTVIDVGCGTGANIAALADEYRAIGIDISAEAIRLAKRRFPNVQFIPSDARGDVRRALAHADVVLLTDVLEHVEEDRQMLASLVQDSRPGSHFVITVPADMRLWSPHDEAFGHYRRYDAENLVELWSDLPVRERLVSYFNSRLYPIVRGVRALTSRRGRAVGNANTDFRLPLVPVNATLRRVFAGEASRLLSAIDAPAGGYSRGVSLIAILQREPTSPDLSERAEMSSSEAATRPELAAL
jgi:SAM-dependent methyltransferase